MTETRQKNVCHMKTKDRAVTRWRRPVGGNVTEERRLELATVAEVNLKRLLSKLTFER